MAFLQQTYLGSKSLHFFITLFPNLAHFTMKTILTTQHAHLRFNLVNDEPLQRAYITDIAPNSLAAKISLSIKASRRKVWGKFLTSINHHPVFSTADTYKALENIQNEGVYKTIDLTIAPQKENVTQRHPQNCKWSQNFCTNHKMGTGNFHS